MHINPVIVLAAVFLCIAPSQAPSAPIDLALQGTASASSIWTTAYGASNVIDGQLNNASRWISALDSHAPQTLTITLPKTHEIGCLQIATGWYSGAKWTQPAVDFSFEYRSGEAWIPIPGASATSNADNVVEFRLSTPVKTDAIRLVVNRPSVARVVEVRIYAPSADYEALVLPTGRDAIWGPLDLHLPKIYVNQIGYDLDGPKRFTAPDMLDGTEFAIRNAVNGSALFHGRIEGRIGDFSDFRPTRSGKRYVIDVAGSISDSFDVGPRLLENACLAPALRFMIDDRSVIGTHPSAFGGCPWRDGTYYSYEVPSLVMLYLSNRTYFDSLPAEIDVAADCRRFSSPTFKLVSEPSDAGVLDTVREYYADIDPPAKGAPDIVKLIHWGIGWYLLKPTSKDPSGDPAGDMIHPQTIEQFAYFLYGYPQYQKYFTPKFYDRARDFAFDQWEKVGLLNVNPTVGSWKGREAVGHSILPNVLMYEVAHRLGRSDAQRYLDAAARQANWIVTNLDPADPRIAKGQRMSEHKTITGLTTLQARYPQSAPHGLREWLDKWTDTMIARSDNMWDFRRYDEHSWAIPPATPGAPDGEWTNDCGNVAGFPACALSVANVIFDKQKAARLRQIAAAQFDSLFGRNPIGASAAWRGPRDYPGVVRGWPLAFPPGVCASLDLVRGTLNASPTPDQYPNNPEGCFSHPEGWTAFNAAFNVSLAYATAKGAGLYSDGE